MPHDPDLCVGSHRREQRLWFSKPGASRSGDRARGDISAVREPWASSIDGSKST